MFYGADQSARMPCASSTAFSACAWNDVFSGIAMAMSFFVIFASVSVVVIDYVAFVILSVIVLVVWGVLVAVTKRSERQRKRIEYFQPRCKYRSDIRSSAFAELLFILFILPSRAEYDITTKENKS